jgi:hypothetical protein
MKMIRPPVEGFVPLLGFFDAEVMRWGRVALRVLKDPRVSISRTVRKALDERPEMGDRKLPAAPALEEYQRVLAITRRAGISLHDIVNSSQFPHTSIDSTF